MKMEKKYHKYKNSPQWWFEEYSQIWLTELWIFKMYFYIPGFMHVMMSSETLEALLHSPKVSFAWGMVYSAWTQNFALRKRGGCNLPPRRKAYKYFIADRTGSYFAFRNLESLS